MTTDLPMPRVGPVGAHAPKPMKVVLNWGRRYSLWVLSLIHISEPTRRLRGSRMPSSA